VCQSGWPERLSKGADLNFIPLHTPRAMASSLRVFMNLDEQSVFFLVQIAFLQVRLTIDKSGIPVATSVVYIPSSSADPLILRLDVCPTICHECPHKTTVRGVYDDARQRVGADLGSIFHSDRKSNAPFDVLMWNSDDEITETSIANFAVELSDTDLQIAVGGINGQLPSSNGVNLNEYDQVGRERSCLVDEPIFVTPRLSSGLIAGVMRAELLAKGRIREGIILTADIMRFAQVRQRQIDWLALLIFVTVLLSSGLFHILFILLSLFLQLN